jgi:hypothetical protein
MVFQDWTNEAIVWWAVVMSTREQSTASQATANGLAALASKYVEHPLLCLYTPGFKVMLEEYWKSDVSARIWIKRMLTIGIVVTD